MATLRGANIQALADELTNDPNVVGYSGMTDQQAADSLNTKNIDRNLSALDTSIIFEAIDLTEYNLLTDAKKADVHFALQFGTVDPFGSAADLLVDAFGGGSTTITALAPLRKEQISRAEELGYDGTVTAGHVEMARAL